MNALVDIFDNFEELNDFGARTMLAVGSIVRVITSSSDL